MKNSFNSTEQINTGERTKTIINKAQKTVDKTIEDLSNKFLLTIDEAARYFGIGQEKLRSMASYGEIPDWVVYNGKRLLIKRVLLEKYILNAETI